MKFLILIFWGLGILSLETLPGKVIASTILAMKFLDKFAIINRVVIANLKKEEWLEPNHSFKYIIDPKTYVEHLRLIREKAKDSKMSLRDYERRLFEKGSN